MEHYTMNKKANGKVQRVFACALVFFCLAALLIGFASLNAYADGGSQNISDPTGLVDVDLTWGAMSFTYTDEYTRWNPNTHKYDSEIKASWNIEDNAITVTNNGAAVQANFSAELAVNTVNGVFKETTNAAGSPTYSAELGSNESKTVYFELSGDIATTYDYIGKILVSIIAK